MSNQSTTHSTMVYAAVDAENLLHPVRCAPPEVFHWAVSQLVAQVAAAGAASATVVCDRQLASRLATSSLPATWRLFPGASGTDRADGELADRLTWDVPATTRTVLIGSGDHVFAGVARQHRRAGREVAVLARAGSVSAQLYCAANRYVPFAGLELPAARVVRRRPAAAGTRVLQPA